MAELAAQQRITGDVSFVWQHPRLADVRAALLKLIEHAQNFSEIMHGAPLLYNLMLAEQAKRKSDIDKYRRRFDEWAQSLAERSAAFAAWRRDHFWEIAFGVNPRITRPTRAFIDRWWDLALDGDDRRLRDNQEARAVIRNREKKLKPGRARLDNPRALELWNGDSGTAQLDFRWNITRDLLDDIVTGLEPPHA